MATASTASNGDMTVTVTASGVAAGATSVRMTNTTTGVVLGEVPYSSGPTSLTDTSPKMATTNYYSVTFYNGGATVGTLTTSSIPFINVPAPAVSINGAYSGVAWTAPTEHSTIYSRTDGSLQYQINGGAWVTYQATGVAASGNTSTTAVYVGYNSTITWKVTHVYHAGGSYPDAPAPASSSGSTGPPPPNPPAPPTGLTAVDHVSSVDLSWTASVGGASGYEVKRGAAVIGTQAGTTKTDGVPGSGRPLTYSVRAYNTNSAGTAYSSSVSVTIGGRVDSCGVLVG